MLKKTLLTVLIAVSSSPLVAIAAIDAFDAPTPVQSYHSNSPAAPPKNDAAAMAQVQAIMAKAKQDAAQKAATSVAAAAPAPAAIPSPVQTAQAKAPAANTESNADVSSQLTTLSQTNLMLQQRTDQQIETLTTKNAQLTDQLSKMGEALTILNQEVVQLNSKLQQVRPGAASAIPQASGGQWQQLKPEFLGGVSYLLYAVLAALVVIILLMLPWYRRQDRQFAHAVAAEVPNEGEYDFMSTHEAIPAKLDLARAYVAMEDHTAASQVLAEVVKDGNAEQRAEAEKMLEAIRKKS